MYIYIYMYMCIYIYIYMILTLPIMNMIILIIQIPIIAMITTAEHLALLQLHILPQVHLGNSASQDFSEVLPLCGSFRKFSQGLFGSFAEAFCGGCHFPSCCGSLAEVLRKSCCGSLRKSFIGCFFPRNACGSFVEVLRRLSSSTLK